MFFFAYSIFPCLFTFRFIFLWHIFFFSCIKTIGVVFPLIPALLSLMIFRGTSNKLIFFMEIVIYIIGRFKVVAVPKVIIIPIYDSIIIKVLSQRIIDFPVLYLSIIIGFPCFI